MKMKKIFSNSQISLLKCSNSYYFTNYSKFSFNNLICSYNNNLECVKYNKNIYNHNVSTLFKTNKKYFCVDSNNNTESNNNKKKNKDNNSNIKSKNKNSIT